MSRAVLAIGVLIALLLGSSVSEAADNGFPRCNCDDEGSLWSIESILECQRVSDFLIAVAYFSIPIELLYFVSCSNVPFKWVLFEFIAFIVLCGMTHLLNGWTYVHHPFQLMLALTVFKILTALVSCATAITLITLIPLLLKVKVREFMLKKKAWDLGREVGIILKQKEAGLHVRMLTQEIRKSLDRHTILYTTMVELSKTLGLQNCAVWMPDEDKIEMHLTHELRGRNYNGPYGFTIPITDPDVVRIKGSNEVNLLSPESALSAGSIGGAMREAGPVAAIRMPMLRVSNFKGGTPELVQACYAILVLVLPSGQPRSWTNQELEIIKVVADQVAVALSHAAILEESQLMREKLEEQNRALQQARKDAMMASHARNSFQKVMNDGLRRPMHTISGLLSVLHEDGNLSPHQKTIVDAMLRTGNVLSTLINDAMDIQGKEHNRFLLDVKPFSLHAMIREAVSLSKCLCIYKGFGFSIEIDRSLPDLVMGDERRVFQVLLHMVGNVLTDSNQGGLVTLRIVSEAQGVAGGGSGDHHFRRAAWRSSSLDGDCCIRFEVAISNNISQLEGSVSNVQLGGRKYTIDGIEEGLSFSICKRLVEDVMHGSILVIPNPQCFAQSMTLLLGFNLHRPSTFEPSDSTSDYNTNLNSLRGIKVLLAETNDLTSVIIAKMLEKLGCRVSLVGRSGIDCLNTISASASGSNSRFDVVILDLHLTEIDGFEVAARIRKFGSQNWPLIVATAEAEEEEFRERCLQVGINGFIRKPVSPQQVLYELHRVLQGSNRALR